MDITHLSRTTIKPRSYFAHSRQLGYSCCAFSTRFDLVSGINRYAEISFYRRRADFVRQEQNTREQRQMEKLTRKT